MSRTITLLVTVAVSVVVLSLSALGVRDERETGGVVLEARGGCDQVLLPARPRADAPLLVMAPVSGALPILKLGLRIERGDDLPRLVFRVRQWLSGGASDLSAWVLRRADRNAGGYLIVFANLATGKVYEVRVSGLDVTVREIDSAHA